jgi:hypothetical protein
MNSSFARRKLSASLHLLFYLARYASKAHETTRNPQLTYPSSQRKNVQVERGVELE